MEDRKNQRTSRDRLHEGMALILINHFTNVELDASQDCCNLVLEIF